MSDPTSSAGRDWDAWHSEYDQPGSRLARRLAVVCALLSRALDRAAPGEVRLVSACAGQGRDVLSVLPVHPRAGDVTAVLLEADAAIAARAAARAGELGLEQVEVVVADAGRAASYRRIVPADVLLFCGVFGNVVPADVARTVIEIQGLAAPGAQVLWTRGRARHHDATPSIRRWFSAAGYREEAFVAPEDADFLDGPSGFAVGLHRLEAPPLPCDPEAELFRFTEEHQPAT